MSFFQYLASATALLFTRLASLVDGSFTAILLTFFAYARHITITKTLLKKVADMLGGGTRRL